MDYMDFVDYAEVAEYITDLAAEGNTVYVAAHYEGARKLVQEIARYVGVEVIALDIEPPEYDGYDKEFYVVLDKEYNLYVEKAWHEANKWHEAGYLMFDADYFLIFGDCNSKIIESPLCDEDGNSCTFIEIGLEEDDEDEDDDLEECLKEYLEDSVEVELSIDDVKELLSLLSGLKELFYD